MGGTKEPRREPRRLVPDEEFPPYSYVTGRFPHPVRDPDGHSHGEPPAVPQSVDPQQWHVSRDYLWGCDLFNHGYYWEAHEAWEGVWHACGRRGTTADFLKGLIKLAAAGVKCREQRPDGVRRHAARSVELFERVRQNVSGSRYMGLELADLIETTQGIQRDPPTAPSEPSAVDIVFTARLLPRK